MSDDVSMFPSIALNSANVPGGLVAEPFEEQIEAGSLVWEPSDAAFDAAPIGYTLAVETACEPEEAPQAGRSEHV